ncbi:MAG: URC4/urg3 family protein [Burkholderiales bacterium]|nr:URC4/urg3 family protein [Burkholderiales bacterium]
MTDAVALLRSTVAVRERAGVLLARALEGGSAEFAVDPGRLDAAGDEVAAVTRARYPSLEIPYHSRWRHFEAGGIDRRAVLDRALGDADAAERARAQIDLALVSVLLDAGAGPDWRYREPGTGLTLSRSEGLGVASFHAFAAGLFSSDPSRPRQADAAGLRRLDGAALALAFQVDGGNPLVGLDGRAALLRRLGDALAAAPSVYGEEGRPGGLFDHAPRRPADGGPGSAAHGGADSPAAAGSTLRAHDLLVLLLDTLAPIWSTGNAIAGTPLGDCWRHEAVPGPGASAGWVPFHKLSQWLCYSLLEPFEWAGVPVAGLDALTGLPEYRNGGLLIDSGVLRPRDAGFGARTHAVGDAFVVEWRALTVALLDELAPRVRHALGLTAAQMPLACVLEGGTWAAGRALAQRLRGGLPPVAVASDGTVF